jgi:hypothetical protein
MGSYLLNNTSSTPYEFTKLMVYTGLPLSDFGTPNFDSLSVIAQGTLAYNFLPGGTTALIPQAGPEPAGALTLPAFSFNPSGYTLLVGQAEQMFSDGSLGSPVSFSFAGAAVPEPATNTLLAIGGGLLGLRSFTRRFRHQRQ